MSGKKLNLDEKKILVDKVFEALNNVQSVEIAIRICDRIKTIPSTKDRIYKAFENTKGKITIITACKVGLQVTNELSQINPWNCILVERE